MIGLAIGALLFLLLVAVLYAAFGRFETDRMGGHCRAAAFAALNKDRAGPQPRKP